MSYDEHEDNNEFRSCKTLTNQGALQSLRWNGQQLDLLDQRLLPEEIVYLPLETPIEVWEAIRHLKVRGAPAIGIAAAYGVYLGIRDVDAQLDGLLAEVQKQADYLATSRPTAVNLFWALDRMRARAVLWQQRA